MSTAEARASTLVGPYRIEPIPGGVAVHWHDTPPNVAEAIGIFATPTEARRWIAARNTDADGA